MKDMVGAVVLFAIAAGIGSTVIVTTPHTTSIVQAPSPASAPVNLVQAGINVITQARETSSTAAIDCAANPSCDDPALLGGR